MTSSHEALFTILSRLLIAYTYDFDAALARESSGDSEHPPSLAMWANVLRFVGEKGVQADAIPALSGIAKPTIKSMIDCLRRHEWVEIDHANVIRFTERGARVRRAWPNARDTVERRWREILGDDVLGALQAAAEKTAGRHSRTLPHYPMPAAHRGALPTGD